MGNMIIENSAICCCFKWETAIMFSFSKDVSFRLPFQRLYLYQSIFDLDSNAFYLTLYL